MISLNKKTIAEANKDILKQQSSYIKMAAVFLSSHHIRKQK